MSRNESNSFPWVGLLIGLAVLGTFINMLAGNNGASSSATYTPSVDRGSFEHRYATERFRQEGYSAGESQQAADAVVKFLQAQEARKR